MEVLNNRDVDSALSGDMDWTKIRHKTIQGIVDTGATRLVLPLSIVKELGLPLSDNQIEVRYANGRKSLRTEVREVLVRLQGREGVYRAIVEPKRDTALIGAIVLEDMDFLVDCTKLRLVPRDPDHIVSEIE
ncbi:MAG: retroviral-like aspartic protease family protein [Planctomycetes bacterium]|nr:retroviral-like aspartic protease family protein [Planctomycetota bacterium]